MKIRITVLLLLFASAAYAQTKSDVVPDYEARHRHSAIQLVCHFYRRSHKPPARRTAQRGMGTAFNSPKEYGPGWEGFGKRYGMRLTGVSTGNADRGRLAERFGEKIRGISVPLISTLERA